jgi:hypothetical protein
MQEGDKMFFFDVCNSIFQTRRYHVKFLCICGCMYLNIYVCNVCVFVYYMCVSEAVLGTCAFYATQGLNITPLVEQFLPLSQNGFIYSVQA